MTASSDHFSLWINDLRRNDLIDGGFISQKLNKIRVKFLKFYVVERLWNTGNEFQLLERIFKKFNPEKSLFIVRLDRCVGAAHRGR